MNDHATLLAKTWLAARHVVRSAEEIEIVEAGEVRTAGHTPRVLISVDYREWCKLCALVSPMLTSQGEEPTS